METAGKLAEAKKKAGVKKEKKEKPDKKAKAKPKAKGPATAGVFESLKEEDIKEEEEDDGLDSDFDLEDVPES